MALATANLNVRDICTTLGVSTPRAIFYKGANLDTLKTTTDLKNLVKGILHPTYCAGADKDEQIATLLSLRSLRCFKGYDHVYLGVNTSSISCGASSYSTSVFVTSNVSWTVAKSGSWFSVSKTSGSGNDSFTVSVTSNSDTSERSGSITVSNGGALVCTIYVSQAGQAISLSVSPINVQLEAAMGNASVDVSSNAGDWSASASESWLQVSPTSGSGNASLTISADYNGGAIRYGVINITDGTRTAKVNVTQVAM